MFKRIFLILILFPLLSFASLPAGFVKFLEERIGEVVGRVRSVQGFYLVDIKGKTPLEGDEVVVLKYQKGIPTAFLSISAIARVDAVSGKMAKVVPLVVFDQVKPGDIVSYPRRINILLIPGEGVPRKDVSDITARLLRIRGLKVKEAYGSSIGEYIKKRSYFLILKLLPELAKDGLYITLSLESLYTKDIFAIAKVKSSVPVALQVPQQSPQPSQYPYYYAQPTQPTRPRSIFSKRKGIYAFNFEVETIFSDDGLGGYRCVTTGDIDGDGDQEIMILGKNDFVILNYQDGKFKLYMQQPLPIGEVVPVNIDSADINGNGRDEIFVTVVDVGWEDEIPHPKVYSYIYELQGKTLSILFGDIRLYLRVVRGEDGSPMLFAQEMGRYDLYEGRIYKVIWDGKSYTLTDPPRGMRGIRRLYGFSFVPGNPSVFLYVDDVGRVSLRDGRNWKKIKYYDNTIGYFDEISIPMPLEVPEARSKEEYIFWEAKMRERKVLFQPEFDGQIFTIDKGKPKSRLLKFLGSASGEDSIIGFTVNGNTIEETWRSMPVRRYISDFAFGDPTGMRRYYLFILSLGEDGSAHLESVM